MPDGQHTENLAWIRERIGARLPKSAGLASLFQRALQGEGELLRVSPQRTVLRFDAVDIDAAPHGWILKIFHPRRSAEGLRRLFSTPPALREHQAWQRLAARLSVPLRADAEQLRPQLGLYARAYWPGDAAQPDAETAAGLAQLHKARWIDRDLAIDDLLWWTDEDGERQLLPLDLGHAKVGAAPLAPEQIYRALARVLSGLSPAQAKKWAPVLLAAHTDALPDWQAEALLARSSKLRIQRAWRRSQRALRTCSDFLADPDGMRRRGFDAEPPAWPLKLTSQQTLLASGPRSSSVLDGDVVWKFYSRPGIAQSIRRLLGQGPGRQAYRNFAALEILEVAVAQPLAWRKHPQGEWIATRLVPGAPMNNQAVMHDLCLWLAQAHQLGLGMRDMKCSNFRVPEQGCHSSISSMTIVDVDGITWRVDDAARDLARLLAEYPEHCETTESLRSFYVRYCGVSDPNFLKRVDEKTAFFRATLAAAKQPAS